MLGGTARRLGRPTARGGRPLQLLELASQLVRLGRPTLRYINFDQLFPNGCRLGNLSNCRKCLRQKRKGVLIMRVGLEALLKLRDCTLGVALSQVPLCHLPRQSEVVAVQSGNAVEYALVLVHSAVAFELLSRPLELGRRLGLEVAAGVHLPELDPRADVLRIQVDYLFVSVQRGSDVPALLVLLRD